MRFMRAACIAAALALSATAGSAQQKSKPVKKPASMGGMSGMGDTTGMAGMDMGGAHDSAMAMPIPMPKGMFMMPGLVGLLPNVTPFLPGAGVKPSTLPSVAASKIVRLRSGDTLDLTATLVRRTIRGRTFVMYGFNGQVPGPLIPGYHRIEYRRQLVVGAHLIVEPVHQDADIVFGGDIGPGQTVVIVCHHSTLKNR